jgi:hypothetical protein
MFNCSMCRKFLLALIIAPAFFSCQSKKVSLNENTKANSNDFIEAFPGVSLPYEITNVILQNEQNDSFFVNYRTFTHFVPDSILTRHFGKTARPKIYLLGKSRSGKNEYYLFFNAINSEKEITFVSCFTKEQKFSAARVLFVAQDQGYHAMAILDPKFTITVTHQHKNTSGELLYKKDVYIYNDAGKFILILTESNEPNEGKLTVINPIDTLPHKHLFSGDYIQDKRNLVSVRDQGKDASRFMFFIHFEKDNGDCKGELKGSAKFISPTIAQYHSYNDPCGLQFSFKGNEVYIKEIAACGSHRDIKCFFEGLYQRKKELRKKTFKRSR